MEFPGTKSRLTVSKDTEPSPAAEDPLPGGQEEERRLVERCREGDLEAFDCLLGRHQDAVYRTALRLLGDPEEAMDLAQDVLVTAFRKIAQFRGESRVSTWLYRITVNLARNRWKSASRRPIVLSLDGNPHEHDDNPGPGIQVASGNPGPREHAAGREILEALDREVGQLEDGYREVIVLRHVENLSYDEIAEALGVNLGTVKSRLARARNLLRKRLGPMLDSYLGK